MIHVFLRKNEIYVEVHTVKSRSVSIRPWDSQVREVFWFDRVTRGIHDKSGKDVLHNFAYAICS
jgi:hypothetical protein